MAGVTHPADPRRAPDDQRRPVPAARRARGRDLLPDRPRHGHLLLRAPARRRHGGRLLRPPRDPATTPRTSPRSSSPSSRRPSCRSPPTTSTRSSSRPYELMPDAARRRGRRDPLRHQRPALADLRRLPDPRRDAEVKGLWSAAAVWIKEGPGVGRAVAEWMTDGHSEIDVHHSDIARFYPHQRAASTSGCAPPSRSTRPTGSSTRPSSTSPTATSGSRRCTSAQQKLGAVFFETAGWERPFWYESNAGPARASTATP